MVLFFMWKQMPLILHYNRLYMKIIDFLCYKSSMIYSYLAKNKTKVEALCPYKKSKKCKLATFIPFIPLHSLPALLINMQQGPIIIISES